MIEARVRPFLEPLFLRPIAAVLIQWHIRPNQVTMIGCVCGLMAAVFFAYSWSGLAIVFIAISGYFDCLDGTLARASQQTSDWGAMFDITSDRVVESAVVIGLLAVDPAGRAIAVAVMFAAILVCVTTFLLVGLFSEQNTHKSFHYSPGLIERAEAFAFFIAMSLFPQYFGLLAYLFSVLTFLTAGLRLREFYLLSEAASEAS